MKKAIFFNEKTVTTPTTFDWSTIPADLCLENDQIHIWKVELDKLELTENFVENLSTEEKKRAFRILIPEKRNRFLAAHYALRNIIASYLDQMPSEIHIGTGPYGKPHILNQNYSQSIQFNISHSADLMLVAITLCSPIGIDLETIQPIENIDWIIRQYFSLEDYISFRNIPDENKQSVFLSAWTKKEAYGKAIGSGIAISPKKDLFSQSFAQSLQENEQEFYRNGSFWFLRFSLEKDFVATLAVRTNARPIPMYWSYPKIITKYQLDSFFKY